MLQACGEYTHTLSFVAPCRWCTLDGQDVRLVVVIVLAHLFVECIGDGGENFFIHWDHLCL